MTYKELKIECFKLKTWITNEEQIILRMNRRISEHLDRIDMYKSELEQIEKDIIRYEVEQDLKEKGVINENN